MRRLEDEVEAVPGTQGPERASAVRTFLIADVRGYTRFTAEHGDAAAARLAATFAGLARDAVAARGGQVIELRGDEVLAVFDDVASQAVRAALELQASCDEDAAADPSLPLFVGIGIAAGEAVAVEEGFRGVALNLAARLCSTAAADEVLVSQWISDRAGPIEGISIRERGSVELKGFPKPVAYLEASSDEERPRAMPVDTVGSGGLPPELDVDLPLVGREHVMRWARGTWRQARRGAGRVVFVSGPSGIGKTRIAAQIAAHVEETGGTLQYAGAGGTAIADSLAAIEMARNATAPSLVILDDVDAVGEQAASALAQALDEIQRCPAMVLGLVQRPDATASLASLVEALDVRRDGHQVLGPLDAESVRGICEIYAGEDVAEAPVESIARSSGGVPGRVHEAMSEWAREETTRRLEAAAEWLVAGRERHASGLRFANNVIGLKLDRIYRVPEGNDDESVCPYKGLAAYGRDDARFFFGREGLVGELAARTVGVGLLGVIGASGSGKSSVVAAGLLPSLAAGLIPGSASWRQVSLRPGDHPMAELRSALADLAPGAGEEDPVGWATDALGPDQRLVIFVDQFEEVFTTCDDEEEASTFVEALVRAGADPEHAVVVLALRGDFYVGTAAYPALAEALNANHVLVGPMSPDDLRRAIELPARRTGLRVESALVDRLVEEIAEAPGGLPLLSTALIELWDQREAGWMRLEAHERTGGLRGAVARLAEQTYGELTDAEKEAAPAVFLRLVGPGEGDAVTRRRVSIDEFDARTDEATAAVLRRFTRDRVLTADDRTVEVAHEALLREWPRLRTWLAEDVQGRELRAHISAAARTWEDAGEETSELYRGARLSAALDWAAPHDRQLNTVERSFLAASRQASEHEAERQRRTNRRLRGLLVGVAVFLVVALVAGGLAFVQREQAQVQSERAERTAVVADARRLAAQAVAEDQLDRSLLLALAGVRLDDSAETRSALLTSLLKSPAALGEIHTDQPWSDVALSPDGAQLAVVSASGGLRLFDTASREVIHEPISKPAAYSDVGSLPTVAYSPDGRFIAAPENSISTGGTLRIIASGTGEVVLRTHLPERRTADSVAFSPDGRTIAAVVRTYSETDEGETGVEVVLFDARTGSRIQRLPLELNHSGDEVAFLPDGASLVSSTYDPSTTIVWDLRSEEPLRRFPVGGALAVSPDGRTAAVGTTDGSVVLLDLRTGGTERMQGRHPDASALAFSPEGETLVSSGGDSNVMAWDVASGRLNETWPGDGLIRGLAVSPDGGTVYSASFAGTVQIWDLSGRNRLGQRFAVEGVPSAAPPAFALSADEEVLAVGTGEGYVDLWDLGSMSWLGELEAIRGEFVYGIGLSPDGRQLVTAGGEFGGDGTVTRWDVAKQTMIGRPHHARGLIYSAVFSSDGRMFATASDSSPPPVIESGDFTVWDAETGERFRTFSLPGCCVWGPTPMSVAFSPDGRYLAGVGGELAAVWDISSEEMTPLIENPEAYQPLFLPDGQTVAFTHYNGSVTFWDLETGNRAAPLLEKGSGQTIDVSPDGTMLAAAGNGEGVVQLWDLATREQIGSDLPGPGTHAVGAAFTSDGSHLIAVYGDGTAVRWDLDPEAWERAACAIAGRGLSEAEWAELVPNSPYQQLCP